MLKNIQLQIIIFFLIAIIYVFSLYQSIYHIILYVKELKQNYKKVNISYPTHFIF